MIAFDYASNGRLRGIEVMDASTVLPADFLSRFANRNAKPF